MTNLNKYIIRKGVVTVLSVISLHDNSLAGQDLYVPSDFNIYLLDIYLNVYFNIYLLDLISSRYQIDVGDSKKTSARRILENKCVCFIPNIVSGFQAGFLFSHSDAHKIATL